MRRLAVLAGIVALLPGCTLPGGTPEDPAALGPPEPVSARFDHDFTGNGRNVPLRINTSTGTLAIRLEIAQHPGVAACTPDRTPPSIEVFLPRDEPYFKLVAPTKEGSPQARPDGSGECSVTLERTVDRVRGVWRVEFLGSGNFTGVATITGAGAEG